MRSQPLPFGAAVRLTAAALASALGLVPAAHAQAPAAEIRLADAVRLTLERSPVVLDAEETVRSRIGVTRQTSGVFDTSFQALPSYEYLFGELKPASRGAEQRNRTLLQTSAEEFAKLSSDFFDALTLGRGCPPDFPQGVIISGTPIECDPTLATTRDILKTVDGLRGLQLGSLIEDLDQFQQQILLRNALLFDEASTRAQLALDRRGFFPEDETLKTVALDLTLGKFFRKGIFGQFGVRMNGVEDNFYDKPRDPTFGAKGVRDFFLVGAGVAVNVPLGRGRGSVSAAAPERASQRQLDASRQQKKHTAAREVLGTTLAYLNTRAAADSLALLRRSLELQREVYEGTRQLVEAGETAAADLARSRARVADVEAQVASAEIQLLAARAELARSIGLRVDEQGVGPLAAETIAAPPAELDPAVLARQADVQRLDLDALRLTTEAAGILQRAARSDLKRQVDLSVNLAYTSKYESPFFKLLPDEQELPPAESSVRYYDPTGLWRAAKNRWRPVLSVQLTFDLPFKNNAAQGRLAQSQASLDRSEIQTADLKRVIDTNITRLAGNVERARAELERRREQVARQQETWEGTQALRRSGELSLIDALLTEEQLTQARLALVNAELTYAGTVAQLRFETGSLLRYPGDTESSAPPEYAGLDLVGAAAQP